MVSGKGQLGEPLLIISIIVSLDPARGVFT